MEEFIVVDSTICSGKPILKGTRIMVKNIIGLESVGGNDRNTHSSSKLKDFDLNI